MQWAFLDCGGRAGGCDGRFTGPREPCHAKAGITLLVLFVLPHAASLIVSLVCEAGCAKRLRAPSLTIVVSKT
eukprot:gene10363-biopygen1353